MKQKLLSVNFLPVFLTVFIMTVILGSCSEKDALVDQDTNVRKLIYSISKLKDDYLEVYVNRHLVDTIPTGKMQYTAVLGVYYLTSGTDSAALTFRKRGTGKDLGNFKLPVDKVLFSYPKTLYYDGVKVMPELNLPRPGAGKAAYQFRNEVNNYKDVALDMKIFRIINGTYTEIAKSENITAGQYSGIQELEAPPQGGSYAIRIYKGGTSELVPASNPYTPFIPFKAGESALVDLVSAGNAITLQVFLKQ